MVICEGCQAILIVWFWSGMVYWAYKMSKNVESEEEDE